MFGGDVRQLRLGGLLGLWVLCVAVYWDGLNELLLVDDFTQLTRAVESQQLEYRGCGYVCSGTSPLKRPVSMASFHFSAQTSGDDFSRWKYTNLMVHLLVGLLVWWLGGLLMTPPTEQPGTRAWTVSGLAGGIWLLHPLQVSTVLYTVQRMAQLAALFVVAGLICYAIGRRRQIAGERGGRALVLASFLLFLPLAVFSKENGILFVLLAFLVEVTFFRFGGTTADRRFVQAIFGVFLAVPFFIGMGLLAWQFETVFAERYAALGLSVWERWLSETRILMLYLRQLLAPALSSMGFFHDDIEVSKGLFAPRTTAISLGLIVGLLVGAWSLRRRNPWLFFGGMFFFAGHSLESTILPLELMFEHRNYLPSVGLFLGLAGAWAELKLGKGWNVGAASGVLTILVALTAMRVDIWSADHRLYSYALRTHPNSERVRSTVAAKLTAAGDYEKALVLLEDQGSAGARIQRLNVLCARDGSVPERGMRDERDRWRGRVTPYVAKGLLELGRKGLDGKCNYPSIAYAELVEGILREDSKYYRLRVYLAHHLWRAGQQERALSALKVAQQMQKADALPLLLAAQWLAEKGDYEAAQEYYKKGQRVARAGYVKYDRVLRALEAALEKAKKKQPGKDKRAEQAADGETPRVEQ